MGQQEVAPVVDAHNVLKALLCVIVRRDEYARIVHKNVQRKLLGLEGLCKADHRPA